MKHLQPHVLTKLILWNAAELVFRANLSTLKMDGLGEMMALGTDDAKRKTECMIGEMTHMMSDFGMLLLNPEESLETHSYSFGGLKDMHEAFMTEVAGAAEIPVTKLFGRSPDGMNATGEADMRNYYERIASLQERMLRPALERLLPVLMMSCLWYIPEKMNFVFNPPGDGDAGGDGGAGAVAEQPGAGAF